jgi:hypothetical protein
MSSSERPNNSPAPFASIGSPTAVPVVDLSKWRLIYSLRTSAVQFDEIHFGGISTSLSKRVAYAFLLGNSGRRVQGSSSSVGVDGRSQDDGVYMIVIGKGSFKRLDDYSPCTITFDESDRSTLN